MTKESKKKLSTLRMTRALNPIQEKGSPYQFFLCNFYKRRNVQTFATLVQNFKFIPSASPK